MDVFQFGTLLPVGHPFSVPTPGSIVTKSWEDGCFPAFESRCRINTMLTKVSDVSPRRNSQILTSNRSPFHLPNPSQLSYFSPIRAIPQVVLYIVFVSALASHRRWRGCSKHAICSWMKLEGCADAYYVIPISNSSNKSWMKSLKMTCVKCKMIRISIQKYNCVWWIFYDWPRGIEFISGNLFGVFSNNEWIIVWILLLWV